MRRHDVLALALLTSIVSLLFIDVLAGSGSLYYRDLVHYLHPTKKVVRDVVAGGEFPYWNRALSAGQPMAANPAHAVFYPFTWLILLPDYDYGFQLMIVLHLYLAAWGMYAFLRSLALGAPASFFGALTFTLGGMMLSYLSLFPILAAVVWMPPALLFTRRFLRERSPRDFALAALFFAMQLLVGEPTTLLQTGLLAGMYALSRAPRLRNVASVGAICVAALLLSAVATLPALDHARDSVRARGFDYDTATSWSMPPARLGELLYPHLFGHMMLDGRRVYWGGSLYGTRTAPFLTSIHPGLLASVLSLAALLARIRGTRLALSVAGVSVLLSLGAHTPLWRLLHESGLVRSIRYPEKFMLMGLFALMVMAAVMFEQILAGDERARRIALRVTAVATALAALGAMVALTPLHAPLFAAAWQRMSGEMLAAARSDWMLAAVRGVLLLVLLRTLARARRAVWLALAGTFVLVDLAALVPELAPRTAPSFLSTPPPVLAQLPREHGRYRLFHHASWHRAQDAVAPYYQQHPDLHWIQRNAAAPPIPAGHGVQTVLELDYDLTALLATTDFRAAVRALSGLRPDWLEIAASMSNVWYRAVYLDPAEAFARAGGDRQRMQPVGILRQARSPRYSFAGRLEPIRGADDFVRKLATGRVGRETTFIEGAPFVPAPGVVRAVRETANTARIEVETAGRAFLVMSVTPHKYWRVTVDGTEAEAVVTNIGYQGVVVPSAGLHVVEMRYRNPLVAAGAGISLASLLVLAYVAITMRAL